MNDDAYIVNLEEQLKDREAEIAELVTACRRLIQECTRKPQEHGGLDGAIAAAEAVLAKTEGR